MDSTVWKQLQKKKYILVLLFLANHFYFADTAKILAIFSNPVRSHYMFNKQIMYSLLEAGHQVTFVSKFQEPNPHINFTSIKMTMGAEDSIFNSSTVNFRSLSTLQLFFLIRQKFFQHCLDFMKTPEIQNFLKSDVKMFDILFVELLPLFECYLPLAEKFNIPVIGTISFRPWVHLGDILGDSHPSSVPSLWLPLPKKMSFSQRLWNVHSNLYASLLMKYIWEPYLTLFYKEYFPNSKLKFHRDITLLFSSNHGSILSTPLIPKVVEIGGIHLTPVQPLPQKMEKFISESKNGVILMTFGSTTKSTAIDAKLRNIFRETFNSLPQRVIWKFEENIENISENVLISDWIPQRDILAHKNVKVFISHTGLNGLYEAIDAGVPLVSIPLFSDQISNAGLVDDIGVGIKLDVKTLTTEILLSAINDILHDEKYFKQMQKLSTQFKDRPMSPQESVVYWTEYVLRHNGTKHLEPISAEIPLYQYLLADVIIFVIFSLLIVSSIGKLIYKLFGKMKNIIK